MGSQGCWELRLRATSPGIEQVRAPPGIEQVRAPLRAPCATVAAWPPSCPLPGVHSRSGRRREHSLCPLHHREGSHPDIGALHSVLSAPQDLLHTEQIHQVETCQTEELGSVAGGARGTRGAHLCRGGDSGRGGKWRNCWEAISAGNINNKVSTCTASISVSISRESAGEMRTWGFQRKGRLSWPRGQGREPSRCSRSPHGNTWLALPQSCNSCKFCLDYSLAAFKFHFFKERKKNPNDVAFIGRSSALVCLGSRRGPRGYW